VSLETKALSATVNLQYLLYALYTVSSLEDADKLDIEDLTSLKEYTVFVLEFV
jgi:hypothetical protein